MFRFLVYLVAGCSVLATVKGCSTDYYYDHAMGMCRPCSGICSPAQVEAACNTHAECAAYIRAQQKTSKGDSSISVSDEKIPLNHDHLQKNDLNSDTESGGVPGSSSKTKTSGAAITIPTSALIVVTVLIALLVTGLGVIAFFYLKERRNSRNKRQTQNNDELLHISIEETEMHHMPRDVNQLFGGRGPSNIHPANETLAPIVQSDM